MNAVLPVSAAIVGLLLAPGPTNALLNRAAAAVRAVFAGRVSASALGG